MQRLFEGGAYLKIVPHKFTFSTYLFNGTLDEASLNLFFFIHFQGSEFSRFAFGCHENSDPGKQIKKKDFKNSSQSYYLKCSMVTQCS